MIKVNEALYMLEQTPHGQHVPCAVKFATYNKEKSRPGKLHVWPEAHATGHRHPNSATDTISIINKRTGQTITVNTWLIFEINGQPIAL